VRTAANAGADRLVSRGRPQRRRTSRAASRGSDHERIFIYIL